MSKGRNIGRKFVTFCPSHPYMKKKSVGGNKKMISYVLCLGSLPWPKLQEPHRHHILSAPLSVRRARAHAT